jgi:hypothetical protein
MALLNRSRVLQQCAQRSAGLRTARTDMAVLLSKLPGLELRRSKKVTCRQRTFAARLRQCAAGRSRGPAEPRPEHSMGRPGPPLVPSFQSGLAVKCAFIERCISLYLSAKTIQTSPVLDSLMLGRD